MKQGKQLMKPILAVLIASCVTACAGISQPRNVSGVDRVVGDALPGAMGKTLADQNAIDSTVARGCATGIYSETACNKHTAASDDRRKQLRRETPNADQDIIS